MFKQRDQIRAIKNLNRYLAAHNLPVRMNPDGVCLGLANLRAKYVIEGREKEYFKMLDHIANLKSGTPLDDKVNQFVVEVLRAFKPELLDSSKKQRNGIENLEVEGVSLKPFLSLSLATNDKNWIEIFDSIHLKEKETLTVAFPNHAISITAHKGRYRVYDPNDPDGHIDVRNSKELVKHLHTIAKFNRYHGDLALMIQGIRSPNAPVRTDILSEVKIYEQYLDLTSKTTKIEKGSIVETVNSLELTIRTDDVNAFKLILEQNPSVVLEAKHFKNIAANDSIHILQHCIEKDLIKTESLMPMMQQSLVDKSPATFTLLKTWVPSFYDTTIMAQKNAAALINNAARGGNSNILNQLLQDYLKKKNLPLTMQELAEAIRTKVGLSDNSKNAIEAAIGKQGKCGLSSTDCVKNLLNILNEAGKVLDEKELLYYTQLAIKTNQPHMVNLFIDELGCLKEDRQKKLFSSINLNKKELKQTDPSILNSLSKKKDELFKTETPEIELPRGLMSTIGVKLTQFTDWVKKLAKGSEHKMNFKETSINTLKGTDNIDRFKEFKGMYTQLKKSSLVPLPSTQEDKQNNAVGILSKPN